MTYGHIGSMRCRPGRRQAVLDLLVEGAEELRRLGCRVYLPGAAEDDEDAIVVLEVWESAEHHAASLTDPQVRAGIAAAMPLLTGDFGSRAIRIEGGLGG